jgi:hypothetical protein
LSVLSKRLAALEASLPPPLRQYVKAAYCRGGDGFDAALVEITKEGRGKPRGIAAQDEVFSISVIKGLEGRSEEFTIIRAVVDPKPEPSPQAGARLPANGIEALTILADRDENGAGDRGGSRDGSTLARWRDPVGGGASGGLRSDMIEKES